MEFKSIVLILTTVITGLTAGIFFCWSCSVTVGLKPLPNDQYILAFQSLNREIQNPVFFLCFIGTAFLLPVSAWMHFGLPGKGPFYLLLAAAAVYIIGVIGISAVGNIPLNEALDKFNVRSATTAEIAGQRAAFEGVWNRLNNWRTFAAVLTLLLAVLACFYSTENRKAALASILVESSAGREPSPGKIIKGISVQPRMTASQPAFFKEAITDKK